jgi:hypothetical protein
MNIFNTLMGGTPHAPASPPGPPTSNQGCDVLNIGPEQTGIGLPFLSISKTRMGDDEDIPDATMGSYLAECTYEQILAVGGSDAHAALGAITLINKALHDGTIPWRAVKNSGIPIHKQYDDWETHHIETARSLYYEFRFKNSASSQNSSSQEQSSPENFFNPN